jgi:hypothetical protein
VNYFHVAYVGNCIAHLWCFYLVRPKKWPTRSMCTFLYVMVWNCMAAYYLCTSMEPSANLTRSLHSGLTRTIQCICNMNFSNSLNFKNHWKHKHSPLGLHAYKYLKPYIRSWELPYMDWQQVFLFYGFQILKFNSLHPLPKYPITLTIVQSHISPYAQTMRNSMKYNK